jgi:hypothetical protein
MSGSARAKVYISSASKKRIGTTIRRETSTLAPSANNGETPSVGVGAGSVGPPRRHIAIQSSFRPFVKAKRAVRFPLWPSSHSCLPIHFKVQYSVSTLLSAPLMHPKNTSRSNRFRILDSRCRPSWPDRRFTNVSANYTMRLVKERLMPAGFQTRLNRGLHCSWLPTAESVVF